MGQYISSHFVYCILEYVPTLYILTVCLPLNSKFRNLIRGKDLSLLWKDRYYKFSNCEQFEKEYIFSENVEWFKEYINLLKSQIGWKYGKFNHHFLPYSSIISSNSQNNSIHIQNESNSTKTLIQLYRNQNPTLNLDYIKCHSNVIVCNDSKNGIFLIDIKTMKSGGFIPFLKTDKIISNSNYVVGAFIQYLGLKIEIYSILDRELYTSTIPFTQFSDEFVPKTIIQEIKIFESVFAILIYNPNPKIIIIDLNDFILSIQTKETYNCEVFSCTGLSSIQNSSTIAISNRFIAYLSEQIILIFDRESKILVQEIQINFPETIFYNTQYSKGIAEPNNYKLHNMIFNSDSHLTLLISYFDIKYSETPRNAFCAMTYDVHSGNHDFSRSTFILDTKQKFNNLNSDQLIKWSLNFNRLSIFYEDTLLTCNRNSPTETYYHYFSIPKIFDLDDRFVIINKQNGIDIFQSGEFIY